MRCMCCVKNKFVINAITVYINRCRMIKGFVVMLFLLFLFDRLNPQHFCQGILFLTSWCFVLTVFQVFSVLKFFVIIEVEFRNEIVLFLVGGGFQRKFLWSTFLYYIFLFISDLSLPLFEIRHDYESMISSNTLCLC